MKKTYGKHALRIVIGIMLGLLLAGSANAVNAATLTVCPGGCAYSDIQTAINAASNGDTIKVQNGTYWKVNVTKQLTLRGINMPVVDANGSGSAIILAADGIKLEGFTATGSNYYPEAGIKVISKNNILRGNNASHNYFGIYLKNSSNNTLSDNNVLNNSDGISLGSSSNNLLRGNNASNSTDKGISLYYSSNNILIGNSILNNRYGIFLGSSSNSTLSNNNISSNNHWGGISLYDSSDNTLNDNNISNNRYGIYLESSSNNMLSDNNVSSNNWDGIALYYSSNNMLRGNNVSSNNTYNGIHLESSSNNNTLNDNNASNNLIGMYLSYSSNNTLVNNIMTENRINFEVSGYEQSYYDNRIDISNLVNGKPVYYIKGGMNTVYDSSTGAGTFYCISCVNVTIKDLNLSENSHGVFFWNTTRSKIQNVNVLNGSNGIYLGFSSNNTLSGNNISKSSNGIYLRHFSSNNTLSSNNILNNGNGIYLFLSSNNVLNGNNVWNNNYGIYLHNSSSNTLSGNNISNNNKYGIFDYARQYISNLGHVYYEGSSNNSIYNNFFNNTNNFDVSGSNTWNTTLTSDTNIIRGTNIGGNYWANPNGAGFSQTCQDSDDNGICDSSYLLDSNNIDYLPLVQRLAGDLNGNGISADAGDLVLMKRASIGEIQAGSRYDLNNNGMFADAGDLVLMKRASIGEIDL